MEYGLIGEHLPHSFSKEIHRRCGDYDYCLKELTPVAVEPFLTAREFKAINVTIPYKQTVLPFLDEIDDGAAAIGAVNTVVNRHGRLLGYNTDFYGMTALFHRAGISLRGKKVLILGTGGTCRTARAVAKAEGASEIYSVGRGGKGDLTYEEMYASHTDAEIVINTTPCGMYPDADGGDGRAACPVNLAPFSRLCGVFDAVYNPLRTNLVLDAAARGIPSEGGLYMLVAQGVMASRLFLGKDLEGLTSETEKIYGQIRAEKENIVLIGMPGCGKTTVGKALAAAMGKPFLDTDALLVQEAGKGIPAIFAEEGEAFFRDLETRVVSEIANTSAGCVIATGGGAVLRDQNVRALRRTGRLYFLDRPLSSLVPTEDRPLAPSAEALRGLYEARYERYCAVCCRQVSADVSVEDTVNFIRKDFMS